MIFNIFSYVWYFELGDRFVGFLGCIKVKRPERQTRRLSKRVIFWKSIYRSFWLAIPLCYTALTTIILENLHLIPLNKPIKTFELGLLKRPERQTRHLSKIPKNPPFRLVFSGVSDEGFRVQFLLMLYSRGMNNQSKATIHGIYHPLWQALSLAFRPHEFS